VCLAWKRSSFLVRLCSLASGGLVLRMIPIGRIEVDFVDPSGLKYFLKTGYEVTARFDERGISTSDIKPPSNLSSVALGPSMRNQTARSKECIILL
jgi:hypothetical protein